MSLDNPPPRPPDPPAASVDKPVSGQKSRVDVVPQGTPNGGAFERGEARSGFYERMTQHLDSQTGAEGKPAPVVEAAPSQASPESTDSGRAANDGALKPATDATPVYVEVVRDRGVDPVAGGVSEELAGGAGGEGLGSDDARRGAFDAAGASIAAPYVEEANMEMSGYKASSPLQDGQPSRNSTGLVEDTGQSQALATLAQVETPGSAHAPLWPHSASGMNLQSSVQVWTFSEGRWEFKPDADTPRRGTLVPRPGANIRESVEQKWSTMQELPDNVAEVINWTAEKIVGKELPQSPLPDGSLGGLIAIPILAAYARRWRSL